MIRFFTRPKLNPAVSRLYECAVAQARQPIFYQTLRVPDTLDGRFDMVVFHIWPLIDSLRDPKGGISKDGQALFDTFIRDMEQNLRAVGVSDTTFPKKMKAIGKAFYGRFDAYRKAVGVPQDMAIAVARNLLGEEDLHSTFEAKALAAYGAAMQETASKANVLEGFAFPDPSPFANSACQEAVS